MITRATLPGARELSEMGNLKIYENLKLELQVKIRSQVQIHIQVQLQSPLQSHQVSEPFPEIGISNKSFEQMDKRKSLLNLEERFWNSGKIGWSQ